jgi:hypothetical protein
MVVVLSTSALRLRLARAAWKRRLVDGTPVLVSPDLGPAVVGVRHPEIVLPRWAMAGDPEFRRLMIAHEREHQRAGDQRLVAAGLAMLVLIPWNPVLWWQLRRLRHAVELDCDARVLGSGEDVRSYGELLFAVSQRPSPRPSFATAFAEPTSYLERRIRAMTARPRRHRWLLASAATAAGTLLIAAACEMPRPIEPGSAEARPDVSAEGEVSPIPTPARTRVLVDSINRRHPEVFERGIARGQAVWFVLDGEDRFVSSWVGPNFSEERWKAFREEGRYPGMDLVPTLFSVTDGSGRWVPVVWAETMNPWESSPGIAREHQDAIRDYIASQDPSLLAGGVRLGEAVWILEEGRASIKDPIRRELWVAPVISDRKAQWEYLHGRIPPGHEVTAANFSVIGTGGETIPVAYAMKYVPR